MSSSSTPIRLAVYGSLGPGRPNHHVLEPLGGRWFEGTVRGRLVDEGWGAAMGYPGIVLDDDAPAVDVWVLESDRLRDFWARLDEFEGPGYKRTDVEVESEAGHVTVEIYVLSAVDGS